MKKIIICILAIALLIFSGCAPKTSPEQTPDEIPQDGITTMFLYVNDYKLEITLANNSSVDALTERLTGGDIAFTASENGGFEIYGSIGSSLPTNNERITADVGDVLLYAGNNLCFFYGKNTYSYTRIGKIAGYSADELCERFRTNNGKVQLKISLK